MMKRTSINLDSELLGAAAGVLGTERITDTVHAAMREVVKHRRLQELADHRFHLTLEELKEMRAGRSFDHLVG